MEMRIPPHKIKSLLASNPLKSRILVRRLTTHKAAIRLAESTGQDTSLAGMDNTVLRF